MSVQTQSLIVLAPATAYALEQRRKRKEEEARQAAEAQQKSARRNAAEALQRIQNWLIGQHIQKQQEEAARQAQQRAMNAKIARMEEAEGAALAAAMKPPVKPQRAEQAYQAYRAGERNAEVIAADYQSRKAIQDFRAGERASYKPAAQPKSWWQRVGEWVQDKVDKFVMHPPSWLSVSYSSPFSLANATVDEWVSYQPWARGGDLLHSVGYQTVSVSLESTTKLTSNPSGKVDINFSNGRLTFKGTERNGIRQDWFIQPFALSFGHVTNYPDRTLDVTTVDIDLIGTNWASVKVSQSSGSVITTKMSEDGKFASTTTTLGKVDISVHRYPRLLVLAGGLVLVFKAGIALAPALVPAIPALQRVLQQAVR